MRRKTALSLLLLPSALGVAAFFLLPLLLVLGSSLGEGGFACYARTLRNPMFRLGAGNFLLFSLVAMATAMAVSLGLALLLRRMGRGAGPLLFCLLLPFVVPSGSTAFFWNSVFGLHGVINRLLYQWGLPVVMWDSTRAGILIPVVIYLWRSCGFFALVLLVGLRQIPEGYYQLARLEGAGRWTLFRRVTLVYLTPTLLVTLLLAFMATFCISRELFMLFGSYPGRPLYFFQHFIANQLVSMDLPVLSAAAVLVICAVALAALPLWRGGERTFAAFQGRGEWNAPERARRPGRGEAVLALLLAVLFLLPVLFTLATSLMPAAEAAGRYSPQLLEQNAGSLSRGGLHFVEPAIFPARPTLEQYAGVLLDPVYLRQFWNGVALLLPILALHLAVSVPAAYALFRARGRWARVLLPVYLLLTLLPPQVMLTPQYMLFRHLPDALAPLAVILPAAFAPVGACLIRLQLQGFPAQCVEAAQLDGAGEWRSFTRVVLPGMRGSVAVLIIYLFAEYWNLVDQAVVFLGGEYRLPLSVALSDMLGTGLGVLSAGSVICLLPAVLVFAACLLWLRQLAAE